MGYVYFIQKENEDIFKIGMTTKSPEKRLASIQTGSPDELILYGSISSSQPAKLEKEIHKKYKNHRIRGEWYSIPVGEVKTFLDNHPDTIKREWIELCQDKNRRFWYRISTDTLYIDLRSLAKKVSQVYFWSLLTTNSIIYFKDGTSAVEYDLIINDWPDLQDHFIKHKNLLLTKARGMVKI